MTLIRRSDVLAAIEGERLNEDTGTEGDAAYERALDYVLAAINALPAVVVTNEMVERALYAFDECIYDERESIRAALIAAMGGEGSRWMNNAVTNCD